MDPLPRLHPSVPGVDGAPSELAARPAFAHASEAELARILDFYGVAWDYEPRTFPLLWNLRGQVVESFAPDFYLPELDLYVELTTLRQKLVRKKNRKLRRLRELYPEVRVKLLYAKDFRALLLKFGRIALADALSGTGGQTTPPRNRGDQEPASGSPDRAPTAEEIDRQGGPGTAPNLMDREMDHEPAERDATLAAVVAGTRVGAAAAAYARRRARRRRQRSAA